MTHFSSGGSLRPLRPHQVRAIELLRESLRAGHKRPLIQAPTGFGKTLTAAHVIAGALDKGNRVIFTVPAISLIDQTVAALAAEGIECVGVMQGCHPATDHTQPIQVCSVQTLARRQKPGGALVIVDEAHLMFRSVCEWMTDDAWRDVPFVGLSATPWTRGLGRFYDDLIVAARTGELIEQGFLSPFVVYAPSTPDVSRVGTRAGEFNQEELAETCNTTALVGDVIDEWKRRGEDRQTLVYGVDRKHAEHLQHRFIEAGVPAEYIDFATDRAERERIFRRFSDKQTRVICNVGTLTTGVDLDVRCIVDAKPTKSERLFVQTIGRGLRTAPGKDHLVVLDHAGNHLRLGLVTDIHHERLDDGKPNGNAERPRDKIKPLPRLCEECSAVMPHRTNVCPQCGHVREVKSTIVHSDENLVLLGSNDSGARRFSEAERRRFYAELLWIASQRHYKPGWVLQQFRRRFGAWPEWKWRSLKPIEPSLATKNWIRSRAIAFAKTKEAAHA